MTSYTLVNYLRPDGNLSSINTRNTNLITIVRDVHLNPKGQLVNLDILRNELQFLKNFYGVVKFRYTIIPDNVVQNYIENVDKLTEDELKVTKMVKRKNVVKEVTYQKRLIEISRVNDGNENHEVYLIKNASTKDMISDFKNDYPDMTVFEYTETRPKEMKTRKKEKEDKETPHLEGKKVERNDKKDDNKSSVKSKAAIPAKSKNCAKQEEEFEPDPEFEPESEEVGESDDEIGEEEIADDEGHKVVKDDKKSATKSKAASLTKPNTITSAKGKKHAKKAEEHEPEEIEEADDEIEEEEIADE